MDLAKYIRDIPDFPKPGILFKDITPLLLDPDALAACTSALAARAARPEAVVAIESRGFVFGTALALHWRVPFVPADVCAARKKTRMCCRPWPSSGTASPSVPYLLAAQ